MSAATFMVHAQQKIEISANGRTMTATLAENAATSALIEQLKSAPMVLKMDDYGGFEKVGALPSPLPTSNSQITTTAGDMMLYQGRNLVIFYGSNSWSYTPIGHIDGASAESIRGLLGEGSVEVILSMPSSELNEATAKTGKMDGSIIDMAGRRISGNVSELSPGIYIINGKAHRIGQQ